MSAVKNVEAISRASCLLLLLILLLLLLLLTSPPPLCLPCQGDQPATAPPLPGTQESCTCFLLPSLFNKNLRSGFFTSPTSPSIFDRPQKEGSWSPVPPPGLKLNSNLEHDGRSAPHPRQLCPFHLGSQLHHLLHFQAVQVAINLDGKSVRGNHCLLGSRLSPGQWTDAQRPHVQLDKVCQAADCLLHRGSPG